MKKSILLIIVTSLFFSCSSDDSTPNLPTTENDPIVAKWRLEKEVFYSDDNTNYSVFPDNCESMNRYEYTTNNNVALDLYSDDAVPGTCELDDINWEHYTWTNLGNGSYTFASKINGEPEESSTEEITFSNNKMIIYDTYFDGDSNNELERHYIKVN